jgi:hypothetical protein
MLRTAIKRATTPLSKGRPRKKSPVRYDMFDQEHTDVEVKAAQLLERIYHKGQEKAWDGKLLLKELLEKHEGVQISPDKIAPMSRIFAVIFWGELAAWKVSAELAAELVPLEAKMAASSQAHDEARHFYVMHDYLKLLGYEPSALPGAANAILDQILSANSLAKKLMGMQLMVEPVALTIFQLVRETDLEPVLCELLGYYERDEARHVALGVQYLPKLIKKMGKRERLDLLRWEIKLFSLQLDTLKQMEPDFKAIGYNPREVIRLGQLRQLQAVRLLEKELSVSLHIEEFVSRFVEFRMALDFPEDDVSQNTAQRWRRALHALIYNANQSQDISRELNKMTGTEFTANVPNPAT